LEETKQMSLLPDEPVQVTFGEIETSALDHEEIVLPADAGLVASVKSLGILMPLTVRLDGERYSLVAGRRRLDAARKAKLATIPVGIVAAGDVVADTITLSENAVRRANVIVEVEALIRLAQTGASEREIYAATHMPIQTIRKRLRLMSLLPELMQAFREGKMAASVAEEAAKLPVASQDMLVDCLDEIGGKITAKDIHAVKSVRRKETAAMLPDSLFNFDEVELPQGERMGEPVEVVLARELQDIIARLPDRFRGMMVERNIANAAEELVDIATGCYETQHNESDGAQMAEAIDAEDRHPNWIPPYEGGPLHNPGPDNYKSPFEGTEDDDYDGEEV
jgi:ParB/RepB/Spo0J family partition protein